MKIRIEVTVKKEVLRPGGLFFDERMTLSRCEEHVCEEDAERCVCFQTEDAIYHFAVKEIVEALALLC